MKDRINSILKHFKLTSSQFADEIGVQRSSVSHVLSGRNKPGFDFVQKIMSKFPEINAEWLLTGVGEMLKNEMLKKISMKEKELFETSGEIQNDRKKEFKSSGNESDKETASSPINKKEEKETKKQIEKIIIIYKDKSFEEYKPA